MSNHILRTSQKHGVFFMEFMVCAAIQLLAHAEDLQLHPIADRSTVELHPNFEISVFAREPDVVDPVSISFDEQGHAFVAEMRDYPTGIGPEHKPGGTIRLLYDADGDGIIDRSTVFASGLSFPTSVLAARGGVYVAAPPQILFLKDTNGDGVADVREVVFDGFVLGVTDSNVNGLRWGLDNRIHGANGGNNGTIRSPLKPGWSFPLNNMDFSFDPGTLDFRETFATGGGFGIGFDDWGNSFTTYNINHVQQRILAPRHRNRFAGLPPGELTTSISDHGEASRIYPVANAQTRVNHPEQAGHFSSAGGVGMMAMADWPGNLPGSFLVCDVVGNLVHRDLLNEDGPIFKASRAPDDAGSEFFASRDPAFRPVAIEAGPDNALYLLDMQRDVIEHPDYIPLKIQDKLNLRGGENRGRIYRLTLKGAKPRSSLALWKSWPEQKVKFLNDPNRWIRLTAQRLILEQPSAAAIPALQKLASDLEKPLGQVHALWTLQGLGQLREEDLARALQSRHPGVLQNAIQLSEPRLQKSPVLSRSVLQLASFPHARVRFQTALSLGELNSPRSAGALQEIYTRDLAYKWSRTAVLSSMRNDPIQLARKLVAEHAAHPRNLLLESARELADLAAARSSKSAPLDLPTWLEIGQGLPEPQPRELHLAVLQGLNTGLARCSAAPYPGAALRQRLSGLMQQSDPEVIAAAWSLGKRIGAENPEAQSRVLTDAIRVVKKTDIPVDERAKWITVLGLGTPDQSIGILGDLLGSNPPIEIQRAALEALQQSQDSRVGQLLVDSWRKLAPSAKDDCLRLILRQRSFHPALIDAIETRRLLLGELNLDLEQRRRLLRHSTPGVQERAALLLGDEEYGNRKKLVDEWLPKLPAEGNAARGAQLFEKSCASCHSAAGRGSQVGPDMTDMSHRSVEDLASNILDPNMAIQPAYVAYNAELLDGETETGLLTSETASTVVLLQAQGRKAVIPRSKIRSLQSSGTSLMPEGLEAGMTPSDLRDLIAFLQSRKK